MITSWTHFFLFQDQPDGDGQPKLNDTATVNFTITDADDQNPVFTRNKYIAIVSHNEKLVSHFRYKLSHYIC